MFQLGSGSDVTSSPTQIPLCAVVNIEITCSNACRNARILSIEIIFSLMKSGKLADFFKRKKFWGVSGTLNVSELIRGLTHAINLKKQCMYMSDFFLKTPLLIYLISFQNLFSKIWVAKLGVRLICECGLYAGVYGNIYSTFKFVP